MTKRWRENEQEGKKRSACLTAGSFQKRGGLLKQLAGKLVRKLKGPHGCLAAADGQQGLNTTDNDLILFDPLKLLYGASHCRHMATVLLCI